MAAEANPPAAAAAVAAANPRAMPADLYKALNAAYYNSFGFQAEESGWLVVCQIDQFKTQQEQMDELHRMMARQWQETKWPTNQKLAQWKLAAGIAPEDLKMTNFLGRIFLQLHYTCYNKIPQLFNVLLLDRCNIGLQTQRQDSYKHGEIFDPLTNEQHFVDQLASYKSVTLESAIRIMPSWKWRYEYNWQTPAGKAFARKCQPFIPDEDGDDGKKYNVFELYGPVFEKYKVMNHASWWWGPREEAEAKEDKKADAPMLDARDDCCICLSAKADTMALPCEHIVVCKACSSKLKDTPDAHICVKCRKPITAIAQDDI